MRLHLIHVVLLFLAIFHTKAADIQEEDGVLVLDDSNFDEALKTHEQILVEFYAPWCGHCKELAPHYAKAAQTLRKETPPLYLAKVDATVNTELAKKYEIEGFPTIKFFNKGEQEEYNGGRTDEEIVLWMKRKTGPVSKVLNNAKEVADFSTSAEVTVVFFGTDDSLHKIYIELAKAYDDLVFAECKAQECLTQYNVKDGNILMFRKFDEKRAELNTKFTSDELKSFVDRNSSKDVAPFDERTAQLIFGKQVPGLFFYRTKGSEHEAKFDEIAKSIAEELKGKVQIVTTDIQEGLEQRLAEYIGVTNADLPTVRIHDTREDLKKYNLEEEVTRENVLAFVKNWLDGKLTPKLKSEDISVTTTNTSPVIPLVGKNFAEIVMDKTKDVLVEFYAPWCGHCQKLAPIYEDLAGRLKETNPNIIIAKIDATANDVEGQEIQGFPTIKLFKQGDKQNAVDFEGDRDLPGMVAFLAEHVKDFKRPEGIPESSPKTEGEDETPEDDAEHPDQEHTDDHEGDAPNNSTNVKDEM